MAENVTLVRNGSSSSGRYYTMEGWSDFVANGGSVSDYMTTVQAIRHTITVRSMVSGACKFTYDRDGDGTQGSYTRGGVTYRESSLSVDELTFSIYTINGSPVAVYGAHPAAPGKSFWYTRANSCVWATSTNTARYVGVSGWIVDAATNTWAGNRQSGTEYASGKITYKNNSGTHVVWFGADVSLDKTYYMYFGYQWFLRICSQNPLYIINNQNRDVASGKKLATVSNVVQYNGGDNTSVETTKSTGDLGFVYTQLVRSDLGSFVPTYATRLIPSASRLAPDGVSTQIMRGIRTSSPTSGDFYPVGADITGLLTRRPSLTTYDTCVVVYIVWTTRYAVTVEANGGSSTAPFYYSTQDAAFYSDDALSSQMHSVTPPQKQNSQFLGLFLSDSPAGTKVVGADGLIVSDWTPTGATTLYAQWRSVVDVTIDNGDGMGGTSLLQYDSAVPGYVMPGQQAAIHAITPARLECHSLTGYFSEPSGGGTKYINADGTMTSAFESLMPADPLVVYANFERLSFKISISAEGGEGGNVALYCAVSDGNFYSDDLCEFALDAMEVPTRRGYDLLGFYTEQSGGDLVIGADGDLSISAITSEVTLYAHWSAQTYTVVFDYAGGAGSVESTTVTWGSAVGTLPTPTSAPSSNMTFVGWYLGQVKITATDIWEYVGDTTLLARWNNGFGDVIDYFGLGGAQLVPIMSESGDNRQRLAVAHYGRHSADATSGIWRNPTVKYMVVKNADLFVQLGKGYRSSPENGVAVSGYMIIGVTVDTASRQFPIVIVQGAANEGGDAINAFYVSLSVMARARAQDLLGAVSGGGELQRLSLAARCDPVVVAKDMMPCASDVVRGVWEVQAETLAHEKQSAPEASGGFTSTGAPSVRSGEDWWRYSITARKEMS